jgi:hypothetical protein
MNLLEQQRMRDRRAYEEGIKFLLQFDGLTESILESYFQPDSQARALTIGGIYEKMLLSATNVGRNINTVKKHLGHAWGNSVQQEEWLLTKSKVCAFMPKKIIETYGDNPANWHMVWHTIRPNTAIPPRTVMRFCQTVISAASFIAQFHSADDFYDWIEFFDRDVRARAALPMLIENEVVGYGFALACDFIKDLGYANFPKPDLHLEDICKGLGLCSQQANMFQVYKAIIRAAGNAEVTPYAFDRVFYLIGSGNLFNHVQLRAKLESMVNRKKIFIEKGRNILQNENLLL